MPNKAVEREFFRALRSVAKQSSKIINGEVKGATIKNDVELQKRLKAYSKQIGPWAVEQSARLLQKVQKQNKTWFARQSQTIAKELRTGVAESDVGDVAMALLHEQVGLIQSIPLEAGIRAQEIAAKNFLEGMRAYPDPDVISQLQKEMGMTEQVATNRAKLIARTETARANASFVQARAAAVGATHYIWRTSQDGAVRHAHRAMEGKVIPYDRPPKLDDGTQGHAGTFPNCRCYQEPVLPEEY